ncbi:peptidoglycan-binding protein [uncultured Desulfosarcina sp.]|uniref:peptidoglycan-binding domain-containing protein n=1 Tax=uncultured Desulfosarcina sp. TaxID=218289 RepID=UPI0029C96CA9|nr:peptidoglycan-binding protein [uncultured Desulfosarcina sp.]
MEQWYRVITIACIIGFLGGAPAFGGSHDQRTYKAQDRLQELGYQPGPADGVMGQKTQNAVKKFQRDQGLPETGHIDDKTYQRMQQAPVKKEAKTASHGQAKYDRNVHDAQNYLNQLGYQPGPRDGMMGQQTRTAIKTFQRDRGLPETGKLDDKTFQEMKKNQSDKPGQPNRNQKKN